MTSLAEAEVSERASAESASLSVYYWYFHFQVELFTYWTYWSFHRFTQVYFIGNADYRTLNSVCKSFYCVFPAMWRGRTGMTWFCTPLIWWPCNCSRFHFSYWCCILLVKLIAVEIHFIMCHRIDPIWNDYTETKPVLLKIIMQFSLLKKETEIDKMMDVLSVLWYRCLKTKINHSDQLFSPSWIGLFSVLNVSATKTRVNVSSCPISWIIFPHTCAVIDWMSKSQYPGFLCSQILVQWTHPYGKQSVTRLARARREAVKVRAPRTALWWRILSWILNKSKRRAQ